MSGVFPELYARVPQMRCVFRFTFTLCNRTTVDKLFVADDLEGALTAFRKNPHTVDYQPDNITFVGKAYV